ncbi:MAG: 3-isopropylmalate dehydratase [Thermoanaerobaculia bacterium]|jgi:3-isopropylmalate/(R)-2-methylmalate dehydratase small subunit
MARAKKAEMARARKADTVRVILSLGDDVSTDVIYPGRYMATVLPSETPAFAFADHAAFQAAVKAKAVPPGSVIAAGNNFGCGSSREQAASCLKGLDVVVVAKGFARIFLQNAINLGLRLVVAPGFAADEGDEIVFDGGCVENRTKRTAFDVTPLPSARQAIIDAGGLIPYTRTRLLSARAGA